MEGSQKVSIWDKEYLQGVIELEEQRCVHCGYHIPGGYGLYLLAEPHPNHLICPTCKKHNKIKTKKYINERGLN